jgi:hypothetical protein
MRMAKALGPITYWTARALFVEFALLSVGYLRRVEWNGTHLFGESEIGIARLISRLHGSVAGQCCRNAKFLLAPINIRNRVTGWWFDYPALPH